MHKHAFSSIIIWLAPLCLILHLYRLMSCLYTTLTVVTCSTILIDVVFDKYLVYYALQLISSLRKTTEDVGF